MEVLMFQSPSLRGSGRFKDPDLQAVRLAPRFNPLHCGAVVASRRRAGRPGRAERVSIPFIAGQWSLLHGRVTGPHGEVWFQSPSLRGSGRFIQMDRAGWTPPPSFQSPSLRGSGRFRPSTRPAEECLNVSIPFIAGQWSLHGAYAIADGGLLDVSIPFIAGQWSLRYVLFGVVPALCSFNPLHCGAVVASSHGRRMAGLAGGSFNPLHCGAVVASGRGSSGVAPRDKVSIPFIAGQWSLRGRAARRRRRVGRVSIPFIAGQWSLRSGCPQDSLFGVAFQSPSLRGSGRFEEEAMSHLTRLRVSIPFIAGQWSLPGRKPAPDATPKGFNPLHCGAVVASAGARPGGGRLRHRVSIPFIAGQWSLR